ncbi:MAG: esterase/lipase family protein [Woeseiaceae bacterium]
MRLLFLCFALFASSAAVSAECVILLHGMVRSSSSMETMAEAIDEEGYTAVNVDYPSRDHTIEVLAPMAIDEGLARCEEAGATDKINFVTHSLGSILVRKYLSDRDIPNLGRVVMLGPPNQGSQAVDELGGVPGFDWLNGPAGKQLGKGPDSVPLQLGPADFEVGIIAGNRTIDPITSAVLDDPDDGKVSVADTKLEGMDDFIVVEHSHAFMMKMERPIELTIQFLDSGSFND